ncbi:MAG: Na+/H+ antiporter NhaC family protein [Clostridia bacterium]|nr:Na+/H+ antiporter NhaC family protein [Clostridia bacterium]
MKRFSLKTLIVALLAIMMPVVAFAAVEGQSAQFYNSFWALVPPVVAIVLALITKEVYSSLFVGIVLGALFHADFNIINAIQSVLSAEILVDGEAQTAGLIDSIGGTAGIFLFLVLLGVIVAMINKSGGSAAFGRWAKKNIKTKVGAGLATFVLGVLIFVDDYFNCLTVGSVMTPVTDTHKISRAKLAFLIDATAAPICMIAPISSWAAAVSEFAPDGVSGISLFIQAIPYNFYSLLTILFVVMIVCLKFDFGPMKRFEANAEKGDLFTVVADKAEQAEQVAQNKKSNMFDLIFPIVVLIVACIWGMLYNGGFWAGETFAGAFANTDATFALPLGAIIALVIIEIYFLIRRSINFKESMDCVTAGFKTMVPALVILTMATTLKNMTLLLGADIYVADIMSGVAGGLQALLPAVIFVVAIFLAFSTGTSWGTFGILIPIVVSVFPNGSEMQIIGMSACLAGAVCGDHCSPISDTTIMASAGAQCDHVSHVSTQLPYALTVAAVSFVSFIIAGYVQNVFIALPVAIVLMVATTLVLKATLGKKEA